MQQEIKDRIISAAEDLYAKSESGEFPNVEAVRQRSKASMNSVVEVLRVTARDSNRLSSQSAEIWAQIKCECKNVSAHIIWESAHSQKHWLAINKNELTLTATQKKRFFSKIGDVPRK
mgnify:CR=1 FL=1